MHSLLKKQLEKSRHKVNETTINGRAQEELKDSIEVIDSVLKTSIKSCTDRFKYLGYTPLNDVEEYNVRVKGGLDINRTDLRYQELFFSFDDNEFSVFCGLPFVRQAGVFTLSGTKYGVIPVLSDGVITPGPDFVFVKLLGIKQFVRSIARQHLRNGESRLSNITYSKALASTVDLDEEKTIGNIVSPLMTYYVCKYGIRKTFEQCGVKDYKIEKGLENYQDYSKEYDCYYSTGKPPKEVKGGELLTPHNYVFYVNKKEDNKMVEKVISSILYGWDIFPTDASHIYDSLDLPNERHEWMKHIGRLSYKDRYSIGRGFELASLKARQIEGYLDAIYQKRLEESGLEHIKNFYDLIFYITENYENLVVSYKQNKSVKDFNRFIEVNSYFLFNYVYNINKLMHEVNNHVKNRNPDVNLIKKTVTAKLNTKTLFGINKNGVNITLLPLDSTTDSMFTACTGRLELQERGNGVLKAPKSAFPASARTLKAIDFVIGTVPHLRKKAPTPMLNINPFTEFDENTGRLNLSEEDYYILEALNLLLSGRIVDDNMSEELLNIDDELTKIEEGA